MFNGGNGNFQSEIYENVANMSLAFTMYSTTFGNGNFIIQPPSKGEVGQGYPSVPYLSLEALVYQQQSSNPAVPAYSVLSGSTSGQKVNASISTQSDSNGTTRMVSGVQQNP